MREQSCSLETWCLCRWKSRTVRNSLIFTEIAFKSPSEYASPAPACGQAALLLGEELQGGGRDVGSAVLRHCPPATNLPKTKDLIH